MRGFPRLDRCSLRDLRLCWFFFVNTCIYINMDEIREEEITTDEVSNVNVFSDTTASVENETIYDTNLYDGLAVYDPPDLTKALSRWTLIRTVDWSTTTPVDTDLAILRPYSEILNNSLFIKDKLSDFFYARSDIEVEFRINTSPISAGVCMIAWIYNGVDADVTGTAEEISNLPHLVFDVAEQKTLKLTIPFKHNVDWWYLKNNLADPRIVLKTLTTFLSGDASSVSTSSISIFARFKNIEVAAPTKIVPQSSMTTVPISNETIAHESVFETKTLKEGLSDVELMTVKESNTAQQVVPHFRLRPFGPLNQADMPNTSEKLSYTRDGYHYMDHEIYGDPVDYDNIQNYCRIPALLPSFSFDDSVAPGEFISLWQNKKNGNSLTSHHEVPLWAFYLYRGSWKYYFKFVCSKFTTARVLLVYIPASEPLPANAEEAISTYETKVIDIQGTTSVGIEVPYLYNTPWINSNTSHGQLALYCVNVPINPAGTQADSIIQVLQWRSLGGDMQFAQPTHLPFTEIEPAQVANAERIRPQSTDIADMRELFRTPFESITPSFKTVRFNLSCNDQIFYWTDFLKRFQGRVGDDYGVIAPHTLEPTSGVAIWLRFFQRVFTRHAGCIRMKFDEHNPQQKWNPAAPTHLSNFCGQGYSNAQTPTCEIEVPLAYRFHFIDTLSTASTNIYNPWITCPPASGSFFIAAGEDYTLGFPARIPDLWPSS